MVSAPKRLAWFSHTLLPSEKKPISSIEVVAPIIKRLLARYQGINYRSFVVRSQHQGFAEKLAQLFDELYLGASLSQKIQVRV